MFVLEGFPDSAFSIFGTLPTSVITSFTLWPWTCFANAFHKSFINQPCRISLRIIIEQFSSPNWWKTVNTLITFELKIYGQIAANIGGVVENFRGTNVPLCLCRIQIVSCSCYLSLSLFLTFSFQLNCMYSDSKYLSGQFDSWSTWPNIHIHVYACVLASTSDSLFSHFFSLLFSFSMYVSSFCSLQQRSKKTLPNNVYFRFKRTKWLASATNNKKKYAENEYLYYEY